MELNLEMPESSTTAKAKTKPMEIRVKLVEKPKKKVKNVKSKVDLEKDIWCIIDSHFRESGTDCLVKHQLDSFNDFLNPPILKFSLFGIGSNNSCNTI